MRRLEGEQVLMRIFIGESDQWEHEPLYMALIQLFRRSGLAGATVLKGVAGFGARSVVDRFAQIVVDIVVVPQLLHDHSVLDTESVNKCGRVVPGSGGGAHCQPPHRSSIAASRGTLSVSRVDNHTLVTVQARGSTDR